jgi:NifU-like protein
MTFPWTLYSAKLAQRICHPRNCGYFTAEDAAARGMVLAVGKAGKLEHGNRVAFFCLVDPEDGIVVDVKFQLVGQSALIGAADAACEVAVRKHVSQVERLSSDLIDRQLRDKRDQPAFPDAVGGHINLVLEALEEAAAQCALLPGPRHETSPVPAESRPVPGMGAPDWPTLTPAAKRARVEQILEREVRPYVELDAGGVRLIDVDSENQVHIAYEGNCTSCISSIGSTLTAIQEILRTHLHPQLKVIPQ